jgi:alpha-glucosidase
MFFTKYPHRSNFSFASGTSRPNEVQAGNRTFQTSIGAFEGGLYRIQIQHEDWGASKTLLTLLAPPASLTSRLKVDPQDFVLSLEDEEGNQVVKLRFGVSGPASIWEVDCGEAPQFFGMGEKNLGVVELSGYRVKFWNTDVWSDFASQQWGEHPTDPPYFTTPYVIAKVGSTYIGFLLDNPYPAFMETPGLDESRVFVEWQRTGDRLTLGSVGGEPNLWILHGPSLKELTQKLQKLVGVTPRPPLWSLGYHQSRWGYGGHDDLIELDRKFREHQIPCDALWMDLDYMDGYRIFKTSELAFPFGPKPTLAAMDGRRIVPIIDPGVKRESGYAVYEDGTAKDVFCRNVEGLEFVGLVWPGETVFPDFTQERVREWWGGYAAGFRKEGFSGCWLDMNDPSTGPVDPTDMRFEGGTTDHQAHRNQYALGMQKATHEGFLAAEAHERPFILSRSGFTGSSRYAAVWSGDNLSNYFYLQLSIPTAIGLSLSGLPFNGPDIGGFGGDVTDDLMIDWTKANFLFPFFRNHCGRGHRSQEPFNFPARTLSILRRYIRLRYKLLPYLYNLFVEQEAEGDPILRPLFYEFHESGLSKINDQFMVGPSVLQAPFVEEGLQKRSLTLPGSLPWFDARNGEWVSGEQVARSKKAETPLYIRAGAILPMRPGTPIDHRHDLRQVHFHIFLPPFSMDGEYKYVADDGLTFGYQFGERSEGRVKYVWVDGHLAIDWDVTDRRFGDIVASFVTHGEPKSVRLNGKQVEPEKGATTLTGVELAVRVVAS